MGNRAYGYEYGTSPRKIDPDYIYQSRSKKKKNVSKNKVSKNTKKVTKKQNNKETKKQVKKTTLKEQITSKFKITVKFLLLFAILFFIILRNSQINESFSQIQSLKSKITAMQKENDQLEIGIQNSLNSNNIEQAAKELLGMQKLTNKQTVYISLSKKDYVEPKTEEIIIEQNKGFFKNIIDKILNVF